MAKALHTTTTKQNRKPDFNSENGAFPQYIIIESTDEQRSLRELSPFWTYKALSAAIGTLTSVKTLRSGSILIHTTSKTYSNELLELTELAGVPVKASSHRSLNTSKGVVRCGDLRMCSHDEILENLKPQGVIDHYNITVRSDDGQRRNTNTHIITFNQPTPPKEIKIGYLNVKVDLYIPNLIRCFKCQRFGHTKKFCRNTEICPKCGESHVEEQCSKSLKCVNCGGEHSSFNKDCPRWVLEKKVQQIRAEKGCSFPEARKLATAPSQPAKSSADVVASRSGPTLPATRTVYAQTDLTWPKGQEYPSALPASVSSTSQQITQTSSTPSPPPKPKRARDSGKKIRTN